jgi:hypothetical protein
VEHYLLLAALSERILALVLANADLVVRTTATSLVSIDAALSCGVSSAPVQTNPPEDATPNTHRASTNVTHYSSSK